MNQAFGILVSLGVLCVAAAYEGEDKLDNSVMVSINVIYKSGDEKT